MSTLGAIIRDSYTRTLASAVIFTALAFALTGAALANGGESAKIAAATTVGTYSPRPAVITIDNDNSTKSPVEYIMTSEFRPRNVWEEGTSGFYTDFDNMFSDQIVKSLDRNLAHSQAMGMGNFLSFTAADFMINAVEFDPLSQLGVQIDVIGDKIFAALTSNDSSNALVLFSIAVIAVVITTFVQAARGQSGGILIRRTIGMVGVLGILFFMGNASLARNEEADNIVSGPAYRSTVGTPLWVAQFTNGWLSKVAGTISDGFMGIFDLVEQTQGTSSQGLLGCDQYMKAMTQNFEEQITTWAPSSSSISITRVMDQMWVISGLQAWKDAQFGMDNPYGEKTWCHVLNVETHVPYPTLEANFEQMGINQGYDWQDYKPAQSSATNNGQHQGRSDGLPGGNEYPTMAFKHPKGAENDVTLMGWAICRAVPQEKGWTWQLEDGWQGWKGAGTVALENNDQLIKFCDRWWRFYDDTMSKPDNSNYELDAPDEFETSASDSLERGAQARNYVAVQDYVGHLSGASAFGAGAIVRGYAVGSIGTFIAYGGVGLIEYIAKIFQIVFTITIWFILFAALFSPRPFGEVIGKSFSKFLGVSIVASMVTALMAIVVVIANVLMGLGAAIFGEGSLMSMIWTGISPALAVLVLNWIFKKAFRVNSPLSISGAKAWGTAGLSGAAGAVAGASVTAGVGRALKGMGRTAGREMTKGGISKLTGGRLGGYRGDNTSRRSAMGARKQGEKLTPTERESAKRRDRLEGTRTRDESGNLLAVGNAADSAGRKELRHNRAAAEIERREEETQELRNLRSEFKAGGITGAELRANMKTARANLRAGQDARARDLGLGIRERMRVRALRAKARPAQATTAALDRAARRITLGGGTRGVDSTLTRFANTAIGSRLTRAAHLRVSDADRRDGGPRVPSWREQTAGNNRAERTANRGQRHAAAAARAEQLSDEQASEVLDRASEDGYGRTAKRDASALSSLHAAQARAEERQIEADEKAAQRAHDKAEGSFSPTAWNAYRRQREQLERSKARQQQRGADRQARDELYSERMNEINGDKE